MISLSCPTGCIAGCSSHSLRLASLASVKLARVGIGDCTVWGLNPLWASNHQSWLADRDQMAPHQNGCHAKRGPGINLGRGTQKPRIYGGRSFVYAQTVNECRNSALSRLLMDGGDNHVALGAGRRTHSRIRFQYSGSGPVSICAVARSSNMAVGSLVTPIMDWNAQRCACAVSMLP